MIFIDSRLHKKIKKFTARPHAMKAAKYLRNRLFYYHGLMYDLVLTLTVERRLSELHSSKYID